MAIKIEREINRINEQQFHQIDYHITGLAYAIHNEIGRLWSEKIYQNELANRCREAGFSNVETEEVIIVSHKDFCKKYYIDLLIEDSIIYELKTVSRLTSEHDKQTLNYLFLLGLQHGKLINFRPSSVQKRFVSTTLRPQDRYDFVVYDNHWFDLDEDSLWLKELMTQLLNDWGAYLETNLFYEAIFHFRGGEDKVVKKIDVVRNESKLGEQKVHLLNQNIAFKVTAITKRIDSFEQHLNRFIHITNLDAIQWINFNHNVITFKTIKN